MNDIRWFLNRWKSIGLLACFLLFSHCSSVGVQKSSQDLKIDLDTFELENGLRVVVVEDPTSPVVTYQTFVRVGSVDEEFGLTGLAHFFEHLMFKGSKRFGNRAFFNRLEVFGGQVNAYTTRDYTVFHETFAPALFDTVLELEVDRFLNPVWDEIAVQIERQVVYEERSMKSENSVEGRMEEALWRSVFKVHPYRNPTSGYVQDLNRIDFENIQDFFNRHYVASNMWVVVVGPISFKDIRKKMTDAFSDFPKKPRPSREVFEKTPEPEQTAARVEKIEGNSSTGKILVGYPSSSASNPDTYALDILSNILTLGPESLAYRELVEQKKIANDIAGFSFTPTYNGVFSVRAKMRPKVKPAEFLNAWESVLNKIRVGNFAAEEMERARHALQLQIYDGVRTSFGIGQLLGTVAVILGDPYAYRKDLEYYRKVDHGDIVRVAKKYLAPEKRNIVIFQDQSLELGEKAP